MKCEICGLKEAHEYSTMCQSCIDDGWRWAGFPDGGYYKEKPVKKHKDFIDASSIKIRGSNQ
jgi:hypothetical protein